MAKLKPKDQKYTVVQHSGYAANQDSQFAKGLESARLTTEAQVRIVEQLGGVIFNSYSAAEKAAEEWMYPDGTEGLIPRAAGTFGSLKVDGLRVYIPVRKVVG